MKGIKSGSTGFRQPRVVYVVRAINGVVKMRVFSSLDGAQRDYLAHLRESNLKYGGIDPEWIEQQKRERFDGHVYDSDYKMEPVELLP